MEAQHHARRELPPFIQAVVDHLVELPQVVAIAHAGSRPAHSADDWSDFDVYVFVDEEIPPSVRAAIAGDDAREVEIDNRFFGPGDEWRDARSGAKVDLMYWSPGWFEEQIDRVLVHHQASVGYSTCFWHTARLMTPLFDRSGWLAKLQTRAAQPYPEALRRAVIAMNHPLLRQVGASYRQQIALAVARGDVVSVLHRVTALLVSYFDVLFALNRLPHPGEKRLPEIARRDCAVVPEAMEERIEALIASVGHALDDGVVLARVDALVDGLDEVLRREGFAVATSTGRQAS